METMVNANLCSAYPPYRCLVPRMIAQHINVHIFNMCSIASLQAYNNGGAYSIGKFALTGFPEPA